MNVPDQQRALAVSGISKSFGGVHAVHSANLVVPVGERRALIGPNGAGKTTLFEMISGFCRPTEGEISFKGERIDGLKPHQILKRGAARSFQLWESMGSFTARESILLASLFRLPMAKAVKWTEELLDVVGPTLSRWYFYFFLAARILAVETCGCFLLLILFGAGFFGPRGCFRRAESRILTESSFKTTT